jgi:hypothetical protein
MAHLGGNILPELTSDEEEEAIYKKGFQVELRRNYPGPLEMARFIVKLLSITKNLRVSSGKFNAPGFITMKGEEITNSTIDIYKRWGIRLSRDRECTIPRNCACVIPNFENSRFYGHVVEELRRRNMWDPEDDESFHDNMVRVGGFIAAIGPIILDHLQTPITKTERMFLGYLEEGVVPMNYSCSSSLVAYVFGFGYRDGTSLEDRSFNWFLVNIGLMYRDAFYRKPHILGDLIGRDSEIIVNVLISHTRERATMIMKAIRYVQESGEFIENEGERALIMEWDNNAVWGSPHYRIGNITFYLNGNVNERISFYRDILRRASMPRGRFARFLEEMSSG